MRWISSCACLLMLLSVLPARADDLPRDVANFMLQHYGEYSDDADSWQRAAETGHPLSEQTDYKVCAYQEDMVAGSAQMLLAACSLPSSRQADNDRVGTYDLYVLHRDRYGHLVVANSLMDVDDIEDGSLEGVSIRRFGAELYGFVVQMSTVHVGYQVQLQAIYLPWKEHVVGAAMMDLALDNDGAVRCAENPTRCERLQFDLIVDARQPALDIYPMKVDVHGNQGGVAWAHSYDLLFDPSSGMYGVPDGLMRGR
jgi:hypothetical protein